MPDLSHYIQLLCVFPFATPSNLTSSSHVMLTISKLKTGDFSNVILLLAIA